MDLTSIYVPTLFGGQTTYDTLADFTDESSWKLQPGAIERMVAHYGLSRPVVVNAATDYSRTFHEFMGCYTAALDSDGLLVHCICIRAEIHPYVADEFLWHEFCHAWQMDKACGPSYNFATCSMYHADYQNETRVKGYRDNKYEVEAREAQRSAITHPLTEPASAVAPSCAVPLQILQRPDRVPAAYTYDEGSRYANPYKYTNFEFKFNFDDFKPREGKPDAHPFSGYFGTTKPEVYGSRSEGGRAANSAGAGSGYQGRPHRTYRPGHTVPGPGKKG